MRRHIIVMLFRIALIVGVICALAAYRFIAPYDVTITTTEKKMKLQQVHVVFRHGARSPIATPPYLPLITYDDVIMTHPSHTHVRYRIVDDDDVTVEETHIRGRDSPFFGRLTGSGAEQLYNFGAQLKRKYPDVEPDDVIMRSTRIQRTIDSARSLLAGLFPGSEKIFDMKVRGVGKDEILIPNFHAHNHGGRRSCCFVEGVFNDTWSNPDLVDGIKAMRLEIEKLLPPTNDEDITTHVSYIRDNFMCHRHHHKLPPNLQGTHLNLLVEGAASKLMHHAFNRNDQHSRQMAQLSVGRLVQLLLHSLDGFGSGVVEEEKAKMFLYSGHDTTLIPLLNLLGIYDGIWPPFASHVIIELYRDGDDVIKRDDAPFSGEYYVRSIYNSVERKLPGCDDVMCPLDVFRTAVEKFALSESDYDVTCANCDH